MKINTISFQDAAKNMAVDADLLAGEESVLRLYEWHHPGLTIPKNRPLPQALLGVPYVERPTGGGVVFHGAGDFLLSLVGDLQSPDFPGGFRAKLDWMSRLVRRGFAELGIRLTVGEAQIKKADYRFCQSYPNPYELMLGSEKVVGFAMKKQRSRFLIQAIVHLSPTASHFTVDRLPEHYLSPGITGVSRSDLSRLTERFKQLVA